MLEYVYTKDLDFVGPSIPSDVLVDTLNLASQIGLEPLKLKLESVLALEITVENVCPLLVLADAYNATMVCLCILD